MPSSWLVLTHGLEWHSAEAQESAWDAPFFWALLGHGLRQRPSCSACGDACHMAARLGQVDFGQEALAPEACRLAESLDSSHLSCPGEVAYLRGLVLLCCLHILLKVESMILTVTCGYDIDWTMPAH